MAGIINDVRPFRALHYNLKTGQELGACLSQPYDVISPEQQEAYYKRHKYNVVRLILNKERSIDTEEDNRYTRSKSHLEEWLKRGIITLSNTKDLWIYQQDYEYPPGTHNRMRGVIGAVRLQDYQNRAIIPHEKVMQNPVTDRKLLISATNTQFETIWGFYLDRSKSVASILEAGCNSNAIVDHNEIPCEGARENVRHRLWRLSDPEYCKKITRAMTIQRIYIADGHHRYQTMLKVRDERRKKGKPDTNAAWEYIMMFLVNAASEQMTILPYHRLLHSLDNLKPEEFLRDLRTFFKIKEYPFGGSDYNKEKRIRKLWLSDLGLKSESCHSFGIYPHGMNSYYLAELTNPDKYLSLYRGKTSDDWNLLDVNIVDSLLLEKLLGITEEQLALQSKIDYSHDADQAVERVRAGARQMALILNPTSLAEIVELSDRGEVLPRKSTFFYPKPLSGLVFYPMEGNPI